MHSVRLVRRKRLGKWDAIPDGIRCEAREELVI